MIMNSLALRLFISFVALPPVALAVLFVLHELVFPQTYFRDVPVVLLSWVVLLLTIHLLLNLIGRRRFEALDRVGWYFLQSNETNRLGEVFTWLDRLFNGGLLSRAQKETLRNNLLRRYFDFYRLNVASARYRRVLLHCLQRGIREEDAFIALKQFLLRQPVLTLSLVDLAETLHEHRPDDRDIIHYMAAHYLKDRQTHFRAEYFYKQALQQGSSMTAEIIVLCLPQVLRADRHDDFACWLYLAAREQGPEDRRQEIDRQLYRCHQAVVALGLSGELAEKLRTVVTEFQPEDIARWEQDQIEQESRSLSGRAARLVFLVQQQALQLWQRVVLYRRYVYYTLAAAVFLLVLYLFLPAPKSETEKAAAAAPKVIPQNTRFALQVAAVKKRSSAEKELRRLKKAGLDAVLAAPARKGGWYKIRVGAFATKEQAKRKGTELRRKKIIRDFFVVNYQP